MVAHTKPEPAVLAVIFERDGSAPVRIEAPSGQKALTKTLSLLLTYPCLQAGDTLRVLSADEE